MSLLTLALTLGCASAGKFTWVDELPLPPAAPVTPRAYLIAAGDLVSVRVFNQENMSARERVRPDGKVSLPFLNDVLAAGLTPNALAAQLQTRFKDYINNPIVTVSLEEQRPLAVPVTGEVVRQGVIPLEPGSTVLQALSAAGGLTDYGGRDRIYVLRPQGRGEAPLRIRFTWKGLSRAEGRAGTFLLQHGDAIVVE